MATSIISTGSYRPGDAQNAWPLWTAVQRGASTDPGYVTTPPGNWLTPTRAIMKAGDLIGVKAACSEQCGTLSVEFSLNNGALLTVSNPTIETDQWGTTEAYWFKLPEGLSNGLHEIRARIKPSSSGNERLLQSAANTSLSSYSDQSTHSLLIAVDSRNYYAQVAVGGTASGSAGVGLGTTPNAALPKYASIAAAHGALRSAMGNTTSSTAGATIYLGAGDWGVTTGYTPDDAYWLTIKGAPSVARADIRISVPYNNSGGDNPNLFNGYLKVQGVTLIQQPQYSLFYKPGSGANKLIWLDDFVYQGRGTTVGGGGVIANSSNTHPVTRGQVREVRGGHAQSMATGFIRNVDYYRNTGDLFTGVNFIVNSVVTECRGLGLGSVANTNDTEHADVYQNIGGLSNIILCNIKASAVKLSGTATAPFGNDVGVAAMQQVEDANSPQFVQRSRDCLFQNISLSGFEGAVGFMGGDPIGVLIHHCSFSNWFDLDSRTTTNGLSPTAGSGLAGTYKGCEIVNSIFYDMFYSIESQSLVSKLKTVGAYRGNHLIAGSRTERQYQIGSDRSLADSTDTLGALTYNSGTLVPTNTTVLSGRVAPASTLTDVDGKVRVQANTTAGAFATLLESGATGASVLPPGLTLNTVTGLIGGTPTTAGTYSLTMSATNAAGTGTKALTIIINPAAAAWSASSWSNDADSGITSASTYTTAVNLGGGAVTVNSVPFSAGAAAGTGYSIGGSISLFSRTSNVTGNSATLANDFIYNGTPRTVTLTGLTPGSTYETSLFSYGWEPIGRVQTFASGNNTLTLDQDLYGTNNGIRIVHTFVADNSGTRVLTITPADPYYTFHLSALANRLLV